jgi:hypothetical protein
MTKFPVKITQVFKTTRKTVVWVEADDPESALEEVQSGSFDTPPFEHPDWRTGWELENEEMETITL